MTSYNRAEAEQWFRRRGLPAVIRGRPTALLVRIAPGLVFFGTLQIMSIVLDVVAGDTDAEFESSRYRDGFRWELLVHRVHREQNRENHSRRGNCSVTRMPIRSGK